MDTTTATFAKIDGEWLARIPAGAPTPRPGDALTITKRDGTTTEAIVAAHTFFTEDDSTQLVGIIEQPRATKRRPAASNKNLATAKQVAFAASLIAKGNWHDSHAGQFGDAPTKAELAAMTRRDISTLIDDLKG